MLCACSSVDRALVCGTRGRAFESRQAHKFGGLAEWLRRRFRKPMGVNPHRFESCTLRLSTRSFMDRASVSGTEELCVRVAPSALC